MVSFVQKILNYLANRDWEIYDRSSHYNIVYVEGVNWDGTQNADRLDEWNDRRLIIEFVSGTPHIIGNWTATTEPGRYYTFNPMNRQGAARIAFGQYRAWQMGMHGSGQNRHEALVQTEPITVCRDLNKDGIRTGDKLDKGLFGINQHHGNDSPSIGRWSAGCLVGQSVRGHQEFMSILKQDGRYLSNPQYTFTATVIPGDKL